LATPPEQLKDEHRPQRDAPWLREPRNVGELWRRLYGDPYAPGDRGGLGRLEDEIRAIRRLLAAIFVIAGTGVAALIVNLLTHK
jgi:hypothetical protein